MSILLRTRNLATPGELHPIGRLLGVIIWINGAFGAGKSTTAALLAEQMEDARVFDPEYVGYMLRAFITSESGDFQDLPLWRHLVVETMAGLVRHDPFTWIVPMSLIKPAYRREILDGIRAAGVELCEVVLALTEDQLRTRIEADQIDTGAREWRQSHVAQALTTFAQLPDAHFIDASQGREEVAEAIIQYARQRLGIKADSIKATAQLAE